MLYGGTVFVTVQSVSDTEITVKEEWVAEDTGEMASSEQVYEKHADEAGEYIVIWEYRGEQGTVHAA